MMVGAFGTELDITAMLYEIATLGLELSTCIPSFSCTLEAWIPGVVVV